MIDATASQVIYRPDLDILIVRWLTDEALPNFREEYGDLLAAGQHHLSRRWLLDIRRRPAPPVEATQWVLDEWLPQVVAALAPERLRLAFLVSPARATTLRTETVSAPTVRYIQGPDCAYDLRLFTEEGEATRWLTA
jgi:hypothetical protein